MVYIEMACTVMAYIVMACIVLAYIVMAYIVMAWIVMAYILMAYILMASIFLVYIVLAYIAMAIYSYGLRLHRPGKPLFAFGEGLSLTTFAHTCACDKTRLMAEDRISCGCTVTNTGRMAGDEVVLFAVRAVRLWPL